MSEKMMAASKGNRLRGCEDKERPCERLQEQRRPGGTPGREAGRYLQGELAARLRGAARVEEVPPLSGLAELWKSRRNMSL